MAEGPASDTTAGGDATTGTETNAGTRAADREGESRLFVSGEARRAAAVRTLALGVCVLGLSGALAWRFPGLTDPAWVRAELADLGTFAPLAFVALETAQVVLFLLPTFPDDLLCFVAGLSGLRMRRFFALAAVSVLVYLERDRVIERLDEIACE